MARLIAARAARICSCVDETFMAEDDTCERWGLAARSMRRHYNPRMTNRTILQTLAAVLLAAACAREAPVMMAAPRPDPKLDATGQYPSDITPPAGTRYPCALTALPHDLPGIPQQEREYINHTYARILRATQAKLVAQKALEENHDVAAAVKKYDDTVATLVEALQRDVPPSGLEPFRDDVVSALRLQRTFF